MRSDVYVCVCVRACVYACVCVCRDGWLPLTTMISLPSTFNSAVLSMAPGGPTSDRERGDRERKEKEREGRERVREGEFGTREHDPVTTCIYQS